MNAYVTYNTQYKVLICREHKYGIAPDYIQRHLREFHRGIPLATRNAIIDYSTTLDLAAPGNIAMPIGTVDAIEGLRKSDGYISLYYDCSTTRSTDVSV